MTDSSDLELYTWTTPNGRKVPILLEELGVDYRLRMVDIGTGAQRDPAYLAINPNGRIPALASKDGPIFESGAILLYLAERFGRFLPTETPAKYQVVAWLMFQMAGVGPMFGQYGHFLHKKEEPVPYGIARYGGEARRLLGVLDGRLADHEHLAGDLSIADFSTYPWVDGLFSMDPAMREGVPHVLRWHAALRARPSVAAADRKLAGSK